MNRTPHLLLVALMAAQLVGSQAQATNYNDMAAGYWTNSSTWNSSPPGGTYPRFANDVAVIDSHKVTVPAGYSYVAITNITISGSGGSTGEVYFADSGETTYATNVSPVTLAGGGAITKSRYARVVQNAAVTVTGGVTTVYAGSDQSMFWNAGISSTTNDCKIVKIADKNYGGGLVLAAASPNYSGGWDIKEGYILVDTNGALGTGTVTIGGLGGGNDGNGYSTPWLCFRDALTNTLIAGPTINVNSNDFTGGNVHRGAIAGTDPGRTVTVDFTNNPVTTFNGGAWELARSVFNWYDPVHLTGDCDLYGATSGELHLYGPLSSASTDCVFRINHNNGNTSSFHTNNNSFTGKIYVHRGIFQTYHANALGTAHTVEVDNEGTFDPRVMPGPSEPRPHIIIKSGGVYGSRSTIPVHTMALELAGGKIQGDNPMDIQSNVLISADSSCATVYNTLTISGVISGPGKLTCDVGGNGSRIDLTNAKNTNDWTGGIYAIDCDYNSAGQVRIRTPGAQGTGPICTAAGAEGRIQFLNAAGASDWTVANDLTAGGTNIVEDGSGTYKLTVQGGTVSPGTTSTGRLTVSGGFAFGKLGSQFAQFSVDIAGSNNVAGVDYDKLVVLKNCSGLENAMLNVNINTNLGPANLVGQTFTILTSTNDLSGQSFSSVNWGVSVVSPKGKWRGDVTYGIDATNGFVRLSNLRVVASGTLIVLQ